MRKALVLGFGIAAMLAAGVAWAGTIIGTARGDVLRGSPRNDRIYGKAGNDRLFGYAGKDLLVGGPGADLLACGPGRDVAIADRRDRVRRDCEVVKGLPRPKPKPPTPPGGLYIALGDSISAGLGSSVPGTKGWTRLYFGHLASTGTGVTKLENYARAGDTSTDLRARQLPRAVSSIAASDDTLRVTINIGINDFCNAPSDPGCPLANNLRATLTTLNEALARDPGDETIQIMEYYNSAIGTPDEGAGRARLLGTDLKIDCAGTGSALGLNDVIHCIALEKNVLPVDVLPAFDAGGESFLAPDHSHPNDAGHRAIAQAFGGAAARTMGLSKRASDTLLVNATLLTSRSADAAYCPPGTSASSSCFRYVGKGMIPGLGHVTSTYTKVITRDDADCEVQFLLDPVVIEVAGRGTLEVSSPGKHCWRLRLPVTIGPLDFTITGGSGSYAKATGSVTLTTAVSSFDRPASRDKWMGTLAAPGVDFDVTPPTISGAVSKTVRAPKRAKQVRVRYSLVARDVVDGAVRLSCSPGSGSFFKLGRTSVFCSATDASANVRRARFTVTVKR